jgi:uncharacterized protein (TIGR03066 family)
MKTKTGKGNEVAKQAHNNGVPKPAPATMPAPRRLLGLHRWALVVLIVALVAGVSFATFEFLLPGRIPRELVGRWRVAEGPMEGMALEFRRDGTMIGRAIINGNEGLIEGTAEVTGKTLRTTTTNHLTRKAETGTQTIVTLTETEFVTEDQNGTRVTMVRER